MITMREFLGSMLGATLYENLVRSRRMRPDLFYRLRRKLYVQIPALRERREDIPILFYVECCDAVREQLALTLTLPQDWKATLRIDLEAFEIMMSPEFAWDGNVRELQAFAGAVANAAIRAYSGAHSEDLPGLDDMIPISASLVEAQLREFFRPPGAAATGSPREVS